ncbi:DUF4232 domain-containing protein [Allosaccharopolyspora coralli]|uniref:DUF4232 domain-containing protein n=1 Tax=Allosaccharopolyspora coralli TaxID=2665642 RepID=A0A5Q3QCH8_9PSEU|nr:DUF4232 domain-containing protein [Allosaccharopolyspora coralli]QGK70944.1 DUF4232 domain-containing protein [Allosaccharopolyspora coralli]
MTLARKCTVYVATIVASGAALSGCLPNENAAPPPAPPQETVTKVVEEPPAQDTSTEDSEHSGDAGSADDSADTGTADGSGSDTAGEQPVIEDDEHVLHPCPADALDTVWDSAEYPEGRGDGYLTVGNVSAQPCTLDGYPQLTLYDDETPRPTTTVGDQLPAPRYLTLRPGERAGASVTWWTLPYEGTDRGCVSAPTMIGVRGSDNQDSSAHVNARGGTTSQDGPLNPCQDGTLHVSGWESLAR